MNDKTYNGWSTYETWSARLWIDEAGGLYGDDMDAQLLEEMLCEMAGTPETGLAADIFNDWIREVNLTEILENYAEVTQ
tara:strand:+ start:424 stop:660 length:237 start_codon:yes stop_codon:yes gene_type:complete